MKAAVAYAVELTIPESTGGEIPRSVVIAPNAEVTCGGWRVFCDGKKPDNRRQVDRLVVEIPRLQTSATENILSFERASRLYDLLIPAVQFVCLLVRSGQDNRKFGEDM